ncbi:hypothetical protein [Amycolatopsis sp. cmx-4-68]|uniref:hypothetical protein n=1 Tax=Amycolatopsis sp. cmx-4-68 TaxID=2790938 RepID=UPI003979880D
MGKKTADELRPGDRVRYHGLAGVVLPYGWKRNGVWHHGLLAPVRFLEDGVTRMLRPADVERRYDPV